MIELHVSELSISYDTSYTEDELEKSLRDVLPSEGHRKKLKKQTSSSSVTTTTVTTGMSQLPRHPRGGTEEGGVAASKSEGGGGSRRLSFEGDSFTRFTVGMVKKYMEEEDIRAQHQVRGRKGMGEGRRRRDRGEKEAQEREERVYE